MSDTSESYQANDQVYKNLKNMVRVLRRGDMGYISPIMDEIFDSEHAIKQFEKCYSIYPKYKPK
jgi:hypothetical protein